jgi:Helix-turn-helix domain
MASADLLLHPVRLRIVQAFLGDRALTTSQLAAELDDVPAGSLYRHVALLATAGVLQVVAERRVRGAVERTYTLRLTAAQIGLAEAAAMTPADHAQAFMAFTAGLLAEFDRYLAAGAPGRGAGIAAETSETAETAQASETAETAETADSADYRRAALWLTDAEFTDLMRDLLTIVQPQLANAPGKGRRRRMLASMSLPAPEAPGAPGAPGAPAG